MGPGAAPIGTYLPLARARARGRVSLLITPWSLPVSDRPSGAGTKGKKSTVTIAEAGLHETPTRSLRFGGRGSSRAPDLSPARPGARARARAPPGRHRPCREREGHRLAAVCSRAALTTPSNLTKPNHLPGANNSRSILARWCGTWSGTAACGPTRSARRHRARRRIRCASDWQRGPFHQHVVRYVRCNA
jgi:hypothetical protein